MAKTGAFLTGDKELVKSFQNLDRNAKKEVADPALSRNMAPLEKAAGRDVPKGKTGALKNSIIVRKISGGQRSSTKKMIARSPYAFAIHFGTRPGTAAAKKIGVRAPQPFLWGYANDNEERILTSAANDVWTELNKALK